MIEVTRNLPQKTSSFFLGNHNGIDAEQREYIADSIVEFLVSAVKR